MCNIFHDGAFAFAALGVPRTVWAIPAIHGHVEDIAALHDALLERITPGDRILYLGNYTGYGESSVESVNELLTFRRMVLSIPGMLCSDIVYLRGAQEKMWHNFFQLQFEPDPTGSLLWMLGNGLSQTLHSYGLSPHDGIEACRAGVMSLTKWTSAVRQAIRAHPGHDILNTQTVRAAYTDTDNAAPLLFVHAGLDTNKPLPEQGESFWWSAQDFDSIDTAYLPFRKVVRGYDPKHGGLHLNCVTATIDNGCGFGGSLVCTGFEEDGSIREILEP